MSFVDDAMKQRVKQDCEFSFLFNPLIHEFYFTSVLRYSLRFALFVYRLIVATLIGNFFGDPFLFQN